MTERKQNTVKVSEDIYNRVNTLRANLSTKKGKALNWDDFFKRLLRKEQIKEKLINWLYVFVIFIIITSILTFGAGIVAMPLFILIGFAFALISAYLITPCILRGVKPFQNVPPEILNSLEELSKRSGMKKTPQLMKANTPELNAMAYVSIKGNRICLTEGLLNVYKNGKINKDEIEAILGHEIAHLKNLDCLKYSFVLSWISIFDAVGVLFMYSGRGFSHLGDTLDREVSVESPGNLTGILVILFGWLLFVGGAIMRFISKIASLLAFHLSRRQEYIADMFGAELTKPRKLASALQKINTTNQELVAKKLASLPYAERWQLQPCNLSWIDKLFNTHPPMQKRITKLETTDQFL